MKREIHPGKCFIRVDTRAFGVLHYLYPSSPTPSCVCFCRAPSHDPGSGIPTLSPCGGCMNHDDAILFTCPLCEGWAMTDPARVLVKCEHCGELVEVPDVGLQDCDSRAGVAFAR